MSKLCPACCLLWGPSSGNKSQTILGLDSGSSRDWGKTLVSSPGAGVTQAALSEKAWVAGVLLKDNIAHPSKEEELHGGQDGKIGQPPSSRSGLLCGYYEAL